MKKFKEEILFQRRDTIDTANDKVGIQRTFCPSFARR